MKANATQELLETLKDRFEKNPQRHKGLSWDKVLARLEGNKSALKSLAAMEQSGGEPDVIDVDKKSGQFIFCDCSAETPADRRSLCFDRKALDARKANKPEGSAAELAAAMGVELLSTKACGITSRCSAISLRPLTQRWMT